MGEINIEWPWQYNFPPFFTLQPHPETRAKQVATWKHLILEYCQKYRLYIIDIREASHIQLFNNTNINRKLETSVIASILLELQKSGNAIPIDKAKNRWEIYWHTAEEWATMIYEYVVNQGMQNTVLTLYEISNGEDIQNEEFCGMPTEVLIKVLQFLEQNRKSAS
ncbi:vacuolar protein-sorting-associated protein 25 [Cylas formicarius]|uniref:vacuolar protein-sorting-associated protein 25 n=1 Tax=Cylas formicarius TaxID=197179 RepID=UPI0029588A5F|nr:vacuolar protein-sorting-associated protein 25 [Cylas formicarius]